MWQPLSQKAVTVCFAAKAGHPGRLSHLAEMGEAEPSLGAKGFHMSLCLRLWPDRGSSQPKPVSPTPQAQPRAWSS